MNDAIDIAAMALGAVGQPVRRKEEAKARRGEDQPFQSPAN